MSDTETFVVYVTDPPSAIELPPSAAGGGLEFNGVSSSVSTDLNIDQSASSAGVTYEAWVYPTETSSGRHQVISVDNGGYDWSLLREGGTWRVFTGEASRSTGFSVDVNRWQHVAAVFEPGVGVTFYKDGQSVLIPNIDYDTSDNNVTIGMNPGNSREYFTGRIDEVRVWNGLRTEAEIQAQMYAPLTGNEPGLVGNWRLDETAGETAADQTSFGHDGTLGYQQLQGATGALANDADTAYQFPRAGQVELTLPQVDNAPGGWNTVTLWMHWDGSNAVMPFGFDSYDLYLYGGDIGFNTGSADMRGVSSAGLENRWVHVAAAFSNGDTTQSRLWLDGVEQTLTQQLGSPASRTVTPQARISGWVTDSNYLFGGSIDEVAVFNSLLPGADISAQVAAGSDGTYSQTVLSQTPIAYYRLGETSGTTVVDSSGNANDVILAGKPTWVTSTAPLFTSSPAVTRTVTNTADAGPGSLRQAILDVLPLDGSYPITIDFNIPTTDPGYNSATGAFAIRLASALPAITRPGVIIDGRTQGVFAGDTNPLGPEIVLNGRDAGGLPGLDIQSNRVQVWGLNIQEFSGDGIALNGWSDGSDNVIAGNYIGTDETGTQNRGNGRAGIFAPGGAARNLIGTDGDGIDDTAEGNLIAGNGYYGIDIRNSGSDDNVVAGNFIGTDRTGTVALGNTYDGVIIYGDAHNNRIGTDGDGTGDSAERNLISGNLQRGVRIQAADNNTVAGNYIGVDVTGTVGLSNATHGVEIFEGASLNLIGTDGDGVADDAERNVISANVQRGVYIRQAGTDDNRVAGNYIGVDVTGTVALGNDWEGVRIEQGAQGNIIGTDSSNDAFNANERNVISGQTDQNVELDDSGTTNNVVAGNYIGTNATGTAAIASTSHGVWIHAAASNNLIGTNGDGLYDDLERNLISGNAGDGIRIQDSGTDYNTVAGNYIGTDATGTQAVPNLNYGVQISSGAKYNIIGTNSSNDAFNQNERNIISGNGYAGFAITSAGTDHNVLAGNYVGTDVTGMLPLGNGYGISWGRGGQITTGARWNLIGTDGDGWVDDLERNVISANRGNGITLHHEGTDFNVLAGNFIGTDATGTVALGNGSTGINLATYEGIPQGNVIGTDGSDDAFNENERNVISGNLGNGIQIVGNTTVEEHNVIAGNYIGTDVTGTIALGNNNGIVLGAGASSNLIGTDGDGIADAAERNLISGNRSEGIEIVNAGADLNVVAGNFIGTDLTGLSALANAADGIIIFNGAQSNQIGGSALMANTIAFNQGAGVSVRESAAGNRIQANSIFANNGLGIDLGGNGVTANDPGDVDGSPNTFQNFPSYLGVTLGTQTRVTGALDSLPDTTFTVDFYASQSADPSGFGEGQRHLGSGTVTTGANGIGSFDLLLPASTSAGEVVSATATSGVTVETAGSLDNAGFETPVLGSPYYEYAPAGASWTFSAGAGISSGPTVPTPLTPIAPPDGIQHAFLQGAHSMEQTVGGLQIGTSYSVRWAQMNRTSFGGLNDLVVELIDPASDVLTLFNVDFVDETTWQYVNSAPFVATSEEYTLRFRTTNPLGGDNTTLVDDVSVSVFAQAPANTSEFSAAFPEGTILDAPVGNGPDEFTLRLNGTNVEVLDVLAGGSLILTVPVSEPSLTIIGADNENDTITVDYSGGVFSLPITVHGGAGSGTDNLVILGTAGDDAFEITTTSVTLGTSVIHFDGSGESLSIDGVDGSDTYGFQALFPGSSVVGIADSGATGSDSLSVRGNQRLDGAYTPDGTTPGSGTIVVAGHTVDFSGLEPVTARNFESFTFVTPNEEDVLLVDSPAAGQNRISGASGGVAFEPLVFFDIPDFTIDTATNDDTLSNDTVTIDSVGLVATGLSSFTVNSGAGDDTLDVNSTSLSLPDTLVSDDLAGHWAFDGDAVDRAGNSDGTLHGPSSTSQGRLNEALVFDGVDDYVDLPVAVSDTAYAVSLWFRADADDVGIFSLHDGGTGGSHDRHIYLQGGNIFTRTWSDETIATTGLSVADGQWHHVVHTFGGDQGGQKIYVDGVLEAEGTQAFSNFNWQTNAVVGMSNDAVSNFFQGAIDEVSIYSRALSGNEVARLFGLTPGWIDFDGGLGNDTLAATADVDYTLTETALGSSSGGRIELVGIEEADLTGGIGDSTFSIDFSAGALAADSINLNGGGGSDSLVVIGDGVAGGDYQPATSGPQDGSVTLASKSVNFVHLAPLTVSDLADFTFVTPGSQDVLTVDSPTGDRSRVWGTSDGLSFAPLTFFNIADFTLDTGANDGATPGDSITIDSNGLAASGLSDLTVTTGVGDDTLTGLTGNLALPVVGGAFTYNGGPGTDSVTATGDVDFTLTDTSLVSSFAGSVALIGVEETHLTGGIGDSTFSIDFSAGELATDSISLNGGGGSDSLVVIGDGVAGGDYQPSTSGPQDGSLTLASKSVNFVHLAPLTVSNLADFAFVTPGSQDVLTIDSPTGDRSRVWGTSDGLPFAPLTFFDIAEFTLDSGANDSATPGDSITVNSNGLVASGLADFSIITGVGDDTLTGLTGNLVLPVVGGAFTYDGGAGTDSVTATGDVDFTLNDTSLVSSLAGSVALIEVEEAELTAGDGNNTLDASGFSGSATLLGGIGDDVLLGSSDTTTADGGMGMDRFIERVITTADGGSGSLRLGISDANAATGMEEIRVEFAIPQSDANLVDVDSGLSGGDADPDVFVITPFSALPALNNPTVGISLDGRTQGTLGGDTNPFGPEIVLDGNSAGSGM